MLTHQHTVVQNVSKVEVFNSKKMDTGDYSRRVVITDDHGAVYTLAMTASLEHRLTIVPVDIEVKGGGKTV